MKALAVVTLHHPDAVRRMPGGDSLTLNTQYHAIRAGSKYVAVHYICAPGLRDRAGVIADTINGATVVDVDVPGDEWPSRVDVAAALEHANVLADLQDAPATVDLMDGYGLQDLDELLSAALRYANRSSDAAGL